MKVLILGGYGVFGGRLAELLRDIAGLELLICGRSLPKAEAFCASYAGQSVARPIALDRVDIARGIAAHLPNLVVDASGPFQDYGADRYCVIKACIEARVDYLDFADAADFVFGVSQFDEVAKAGGVFVLSGVSSFPVLTAAVLREIARDMEIITVQGGIAPSPFAGIGLNVMRAVIGYAGAPVKLWRGGKAGYGIGLAESMHFTVAVPGRLPLRNIHFSLVDVPDLQVLPPEHPGMSDIWIGAGPVPEFLHRILNVLAKARAWLHLPSFEPLAPFFYAVLNRMRYGEHRGGMFVRARGTVGGKDTEISWHLLAEGDDGPYIPSMAVEAIIRKQLDGRRPDAGSRPATHALELPDYTRMFASKTIYSGFRTERWDAPIYRQLLGSAFDSLPQRVQELHDSQQPRRWTGFAEVIRGKSMWAHIISTLIGLPTTGARVPVSVAFFPEEGAERWERNFDGRRFSSTQVIGRGKDQYLLVERFGVISVALALVVEGVRLYLIPRRWRLLGIPLPGFLLPAGTSFETELHDRFQFDVEISFPLFGLIASYKGTLEPA